MAGFGKCVINANRNSLGSLSEGAGHSNEGIWDRRDDLMGHTFVAGWVNNPPYVYIDGRTGLMEGINHDIVSVLEKELNFDMTLVE